MRGSRSPVPKRPGCCDGGQMGGGGGSLPNGRLQIRQKRVPDRMEAPQWGQRRPVGAVGVSVSGARHKGQKRAVALTGALQRGQVGRVSAAEMAVIGLPHCLQKRAPGRSPAPQWGHVGAVAGGRAFRQRRQKRASVRLSAPHCGQAFTSPGPHAAIACRQPDQSGR